MTRNGLSQKIGANHLGNGAIQRNTACADEYLNRQEGESVSGKAVINRGREPQKRNIEPLETNVPNYYHNVIVAWSVNCSTHG